MSTTTDTPRRRRALDRRTNQPPADPPAATHITPQERRRLFAAHYRVHHNATAAAIAAGLSAKTAKQTGARMLSHADVQALIRDGAQQDRRVVRRVAKKLEATRETIVTELARIGFSDIRRVVTWDTLELAQDEADDDDEGDTDDEMENQAHGGALQRSRGRNRYALNAVRLLSSHEIDDDTAAAISEVSQTAHGLKVKMYNKHPALVSLAQIMGLLRDEGAPPSTVNFNIYGLYPGGKRDEQSQRDVPQPRAVKGEHAFVDPARRRSG